MSWIDTKNDGLDKVFPLHGYFGLISLGTCLIISRVFVRGPELSTGPQPQQGSTEGYATSTWIISPPKKMCEHYFKKNI